MENNTILTLAIVKALAYTENGGAPSVEKEKAGQSGELKSMFQFEPETWKAYSKQITGQENLPITPQNEAVVVAGKVNSWLKQGYNTMQIASLWNSGTPDGYKDNVGINKEGVKYNTPEYAKKVQNYTDEFITQAGKHLAQNQTLPQNPQTTPVSAPMNPQLANVNGGGNFGNQGLAQQTMQAKNPMV